MIYIRTMNIAPNRLDRAETGKYGNIYGICRSEIEFMQKDNQKWLSFFVGVRRLKSIPTVLFVHSLGNDLIHRKS